MLLLYVWIISIVLIMFQIALFIYRCPLKYKALPVYFILLCVVISFTALLIQPWISGDRGIEIDWSWYVAISLTWALESTVCWSIYGIVKHIQKLRK